MQMPRHGEPVVVIVEVMKRTRSHFQICIATALVISFIPRMPKEMAGFIRLRGTQGSFAVTVFSSPDAVPGGLVDVSVLVQGRETGKVVLDADVTFTLSPPVGEMKQADVFCGIPTAAMPLPDGINNLVRASRGTGIQQALYAAPVQLNAPGDWKLHLNVSRGNDAARFDCLLPVNSSSSSYLACCPICCPHRYFSPSLR